MPPSPSRIQAWVWSMSVPSGFVENRLLATPLRLDLLRRHRLSLELTHADREPRDRGVALGELDRVFRLRLGEQLPVPSLLRGEPLGQVRDLRAQGRHLLAVVREVLEQEVMGAGR